jgi:hypothetical protein
MSRKPSLGRTVTGLASDSVGNHIAPRIERLGVRHRMARQTTRILVGTDDPTCSRAIQKSDHLLRTLIEKRAIGARVGILRNPDVVFAADDAVGVTSAMTAGGGARSHTNESEVAASPPVATVARLRVLSRNTKAEKTSGAHQDNEQSGHATYTAAEATDGR